LEIIIEPTPQLASASAARVVARLIREKPDAVLGLATGSTPLLLYQELIRLHREDQLDFRKVRTFNLDEYIGLPPHSPQSYHYFMWENFFKHINIARKNVHIPDGMAKNIPAFCANYEERIRKAGGIDLQVLGIGTDAHIGFNEPGSSLASRTRFKTLTTQTRKDNGHFFGSEGKVPCHVITMGIGTIMEARECMVLAFGARKARAIAGAVEGPITAANPASVLQMHPVAKVFLDEPAASKLKRVDYYRWAYDNKPAYLQF
jgi:glucosamine-6-phosphate deaminase